VNTSFNVAAPIAQSPVQALDTLRRANGMDGVFIFSDDGSVVLAWAKEPRTGVGGRIRKWVVDWRLETDAGVEA
jgi:carbamoyltransferase